MSWPSPTAARWIALAAFFLALILHLTIGIGALLAGVDVRITIIVLELGAILSSAVVVALVIRLPFREAFALYPAARGHYVIAVVGAVPLQFAGGALQEHIIRVLPNGDRLRTFLERALRDLTRTEGAIDVALLIVGGVVLAAVCEEILFRGLILQLLARRGRWLGAIAVTAMLFSAFHLNPVAFVPIAIVGAYLGMLVWRSGSIFPAIVAHASNNLVAFAALPAVSEPTEATVSATLVAVVSGLVFVALLAVYLRRTPSVKRAAAVAVSPPGVPPLGPTDTRPPPGSTDRKDPHGS